MLQCQERDRAYYTNLPRSMDNFFCLIYCSACPMYYQFLVSVALLCKNALFICCFTHSDETMKMSGVLELNQEIDPQQGTIMILFPPFWS